jgi:tRNA threonylcarbamoyladenosine biosynthesis protein TsaE
MKIVNYFLPQIDQVAYDLLLEAGNVKIITLTGSLGAGKTTFCAALLRQLGVQEAAPSPTFAYVNMYTAGDGRVVYHFDLYRLKNLQEFEQAGFFEYLYQPNSLVLIEWPEILLSVLSHQVCAIELISLGQDQRQLKYNI